MRTPRQRAADIKLIAGATVAILLAGGLIAAGLLAATNDNSADCGRVLGGEADDLLDRLSSGPIFLSGGGRCSFWMALDDGDVVAYRVRQPRGCTLDLERQEFVCDGDPVDTDDLAQYPVSIVTSDGSDLYVVDFDEPPDSPDPT